MLHIRVNYYSIFMSISGLTVNGKKLKLFIPMTTLMLRISHQHFWNIFTHLKEVSKTLIPYNLFIPFSAVYFSLFVHPCRKAFICSSSSTMYTSVSRYCCLANIETCLCYQHQCIVRHWISINREAVPLDDSIRMEWTQQIQT